MIVHSWVLHILCFTIITVNCYKMCMHSSVQHVIMFIKSASKDTKKWSQTHYKYKQHKQKLIIIIIIIIRGDKLYKRLSGS